SPAHEWVPLGGNRVPDGRFDALTPRTRQRELPRGALSLAQAWTSIVVAAAVILVSAALINPLSPALSPLALAWVMTYSLSKRFTHWPHLWLGLSLAIAPVGGYLAVTGRGSDPGGGLPRVTSAVLDRVGGIG